MILEVYSITRFRTAVSIATFLLLCFAISLWSVPIPAELALLSNFPAPSSVSGKITTVNDSRFTFSLTGNQNFNNLEFVIDPNARIEGKLAVRSQAAGHYRGQGMQLV